MRVRPHSVNAMLCAGKANLTLTKKVWPLVAIDRKGGIIPVTLRLFAAPLSIANFLQRLSKLKERL